VHADTVLIIYGFLARDADRVLFRLQFKIALAHATQFDHGNEVVIGKAPMLVLASPSQSLADTDWRALCRLNKMGGAGSPRRQPSQ
jgi:hypothetical protein